jgi:hypothetical protein
MTIVRLRPNPAEAQAVKITFPVHLSSKPADGTLAVRFRQQPEARFHGSLLGASAAATHRPAHQVVIDVDIGAHE